MGLRPRIEKREKLRGARLGFYSSPRGCREHKMLPCSAQGKWESRAKLRVKCHMCDLQQRANLKA